jgi:hypothetical protein
MGVVDSAMGSSLLMPVSSTWKLSMPMASLNPLVIAEVDPVARGKRLMTSDVGEPTMTGDGVSMVAGGGMSLAIGNAESMSIDDDGMSMLIAGGESMATGYADESMMTGEGAGESVDPDPIVPTVGAN